MATAKKLPSGSWRVNLYIGVGADGKRKYKSFTAPTKKEAEFLAANYNMKRKESPSNITFAEALANYIECKANVLSPTTISSYRSQQRLYFSSIKNKKLSQITQADIQREINTLAERLSPKTVHCAHGLISAVFGMLVPEIKLNTSLPHKQRKFKNLPPPQLIIKAVKGTDIELPVLLGLWCGFRMSEILGFKKSDLKGNVITVNRICVVVDNAVITKSAAKTYGASI